MIVLRQLQNQQKIIAMAHAPLRHFFAADGRRWTQMHADSFSPPTSDVAMKKRSSVHLWLKFDFE